MQTASGQEKLYNTGANIERYSGKNVVSTRTQKEHVCAISMNCNKLIHLQPQNTSGVHRLYDGDRKAKSKFVQLYRDGAHCLGERLGFNYNGQLDSQYNILPTFINLVPLWNIKVGVWCASCATRIIYPLFSETTNPNRIIQVMTTLLNTCAIMGKSTTSLRKKVPNVTLQTILSC